MFDPVPHWRALRRNWRMQSIVTLCLPIALAWLLKDQPGAWEEGAIWLFILGLATLFLSLWRFRRYKAALIEADRLGEAPEAAEAWVTLHREQLLGLLNAKLPAWMGMLHYVCTSEVVPLTLLVLASMGVMLLYRPPTAWVK